MKNHDKIHFEINGHKVLVTDSAKLSIQYKKCYICGYNHRRKTRGLHYIIYLTLQYLLGRKIKIKIFGEF